MVAALVLALAPCVSVAQNDAAPDSRARAMLSTMGRELSSPELPPSLPATPDKLALMKQYLASANVEEAMKAFSDLAYSQSKLHFASKISSLPIPQQSLLLSAYDQAFRAAAAIQIRTDMDSWAKYYANRMTSDELRTVVSFYTAGLGYKMLHSPKGLSVDEREQSGQYMVDNPAIVKFTKINFDYMRQMPSRQKADKASFDAKFSALFCHSLAEEHLKTATCQASAHQPRSPDR